MAIYACGVIAGIVGLYLVLTTTFGRSHTPGNSETLPLTSSGFALLWVCFWLAGAGWPCLPLHRSTTGGTAPTAWT